MKTRRRVDKKTRRLSAMTRMPMEQKVRLDICHKRWKRTKNLCGRYEIL